MSEDKPDVLSFVKPEEPTYPAMVSKRRDGPPCRHEAVVLDEERREVRCARCETRLDPFDSFLQIASRWDLEKWQTRRLERLNAKLTEFVGTGGSFTITKSGIRARKDRGEISSQAQGGVIGRLEALSSRLEWGPRL